MKNILLWRTGDSQFAEIYLQETTNFCRYNLNGGKSLLGCFSYSWKYYKYTVAQ